jgi:5-methylcytosine-specific restriction protein A
VAYRRQHPFCEECEAKGVDRICDVVDHMIPLVDGGEKFDLENVWSLCNRCHNGLKRDMERFARANGLIHELPKWCRKPDTRPAKFRRG